MLQALESQTEGLRRHAGALIAAGAVCIAGLAQVGAPGSTTMVALAFFVAGLSHGAADEDHAAIRPYGPSRALAYILIAAAVAALFLIAPIAAITAFFGLSAWHFASSECPFDRLTRAGIAGLAIGGSALFRPTQTAQVLEAIAGGPMPGEVVLLLAITGGAGALCVAVAALYRRDGFAFGLLALIATMVFDPALAVGLIFLVAHAVPVQQRQIERHGFESVFHAVAKPSLIAIAGAVLIGGLTWAGAIPLPIAAALAFGLATPHMLTERI